MAVDPPTTTAIRPKDAKLLAPPEPAQDAWSVAWRQFQKNRLAMAALVVVMVLFGLACFAPLLANGRPLWLRGHLTHVYETDVAAFSDWSARLQAAAAELRAGAAGKEREALLERVALYRAGLPGILRRIGDALSPEQAAALAPLAQRFGQALEGGDGHPDGVDLATLAELTATIERDQGALSLGAAYKRAAAPLLRVSELSEAWDDLRATRSGGPADEAARQALLAEAREVAARTRAGVTAVNLFLPAEEDVRLSQAAAPALDALERLDREEMAALRARVQQLEAALDRAAALPVDPGLQLLPMETRWPAFAYLSAGEVGFMVLYLSVLAAVGLRGALGALPPGGRLLVVCAPALLAALAWRAAVPDVLPPAESLYKRFAEQLRQHPDGSGGGVLFPLIPFGENENIYADRVTPPILSEHWQLAAYEAKPAGPAEGGPVPSLMRRLREPGEEQITAATARDRLTRLRSHWLGTDANGRDVLARLVLGSRVSLSVGFVAVGIYVTIGVILGAVAGYFRGGWDIFLGRLVEIVDCFPYLFLIISLMALVSRPSIFYIMIVIGLTHWTGVMRLVRGEFLRLVGLDFVAAARALGLSRRRVVFRHVLPNALGPVLVTAAFGVAGAILTESALSFLGFGVPAPQASWGSVLHDARGNEQALWWVTVFPGALIFVTVTAYNLVGEGLRDALDPRLRR